MSASVIGATENRPSANSTLDGGGSHQPVRYIATPHCAISVQLTARSPARRDIERHAKVRVQKTWCIPRPGPLVSLEETYHEHSSGLSRDFSFRKMYFGAVLF
jgi:hypothetical protein